MPETGGDVLNARRHRGGDHAALPPAQQVAIKCSTPGGIGAAITGRRREPPALGCAVLNARRHRGGDHSSTALHRPRTSSGAQRPEASGRRSRDRGPRRAARACRCSTPGGIGAAITVHRYEYPVRGWSAQRPEASGRRSLERCVGEAAPDWFLCSTPGGIGAAITATPSARAVLPGVLNARRHRGGDHHACALCTVSRHVVLNARRHRGGDHLNSTAAM